MMMIIPLPLLLYLEDSMSGPLRHEAAAVCP